MIDLTFSLQERGGAYKREGHRYIEEIIAELPGLRQVKCLINYAIPHGYYSIFLVCLRLLEQLRENLQELRLLVLRI